MPNILTITKDCNCIRYEESDKNVIRETEIVDSPVDAYDIKKLKYSSIREAKQSGIIDTYAVQKTLLYHRSSILGKWIDNMGLMPDKLMVAPVTRIYKIAVRYKALKELNEISSNLEYFMKYVEQHNPAPDDYISGYAFSAIVLGNDRYNSAKHNTNSDAGTKRYMLPIGTEIIFHTFGNAEFVMQQKSSFENAFSNDDKIYILDEETNDYCTLSDVECIAMINIMNTISTRIHINTDIFLNNIEKEINMLKNSGKTNRNTKTQSTNFANLTASGSANEDMDLYQDLDQDLDAATLYKALYKQIFK